MPIEDVDYLIANSEPQSLLFFVDSANRNKQIYPNPNYYVYEFPETLRNVFHFEILDSAIPCSMFNLDFNNDSFAYCQIFSRDVFDKTYFSDIFIELQQDPNFKLIFNKSEDADIFICNDQVAFDYVKNLNASSSNTIMFIKHVLTSPYVTPVKGSSYYINDLEFVYFTYQAYTYSVPRTDPVANLILLGGFTFTNGNTFTYFDYTYVDDTTYVDILTDLSTTIYNRKADPTSTTYDTATMKMSSYYIANVYTKFERGIYSMVDLQTYLNTVFKTVCTSTRFYNYFPTASWFSVQQSSVYGTITRQSKFKFSYNEDFPFIFDMKKSSSGEVLGFNTLPTITENTFYQVLENLDNDYLFMSLPSTNPTTGSVSNYIIAPGVINLQGARFILLRSPEIESHMYNSFAYSQQCPGIAYLKMAAGSMDVTHLRYDFVSLSRKPFHPIGKLPRITLKFELPSGELYDFKGIDHNLFLQVKVYTVKNRPQLDKYLLNQNYNPDILTYQFGDNDDESNSEASQPNSEIIQKQLKYDYNDDRSES